MPFIFCIDKQRRDRTYLHITFPFKIKQFSVSIAKKIGLNLLKKK